MHWTLPQQSFIVLVLFLVLDIDFYVLFIALSCLYFMLVVSQPGFPWDKGQDRRTNNNIVQLFECKHCLGAKLSS